MAGTTLTVASGDETRRYRYLQLATLVYVLGLVVHTADHVRRGTDVITPEVFWAGIVSTSIGLVVVALVFLRHPTAPLLATAFGFAEAIGVVSAHLLPHWGAFSDPFIGHQAPGITPWSWVVVSIEIAGALGMGVAGWTLIRRPTPT